MGGRTAGTGPVRPADQGGYEERPDIGMPDRRVRVFVSSTLQEVSEERRVARTAISGLHMTPVMFELGARPYPPRELYRAYLAQSDVFVGIYWQSYGWVAPAETVSGLEDEYLHAGDRPKLIYVKTSAQREPRLQDLLKRIRSDDQAAYKHFDHADELADLLANDLAVLLTERFTSSRRADPGGLRGARLPVPPTPLIGRTRELATISTLLSDPAVRIVTLVGSGGIGKTRLALEVARSLSTATFPSPADSSAAAHPLDGIWFVDLAAVTDPGRWLEPVATALGIRLEGTAAPLDLIADRLQDLRMLLVLDNFEQLLAAAPELAQLLAACPGLTVLVTSRVVLRLRGEREILLTPLALPEIGEDDSAVLGQSAAVQLFVARAQEVRSGFSLNVGNAAVVGELCRRMEGIPLALELAAAQLRVLTPAALLHRLGSRLDRLDLSAGLVDLPARQRTLRATVDWSYSRLSETERALLARLSVFTGAWTLEEAEAVGAVHADLDVLETVSSLVAQSLVTADDRPAEEPWFRMLDAVRSYARERLSERGETDATLRRLGGHILEFARAAAAGMAGPDNLSWSNRIDNALDDIRTVITWAIGADDAATVARLLAPLSAYLWSRGLLPWAKDITERTAALASAAALPGDDAVLLLWVRGISLVTVGRTADARPLLQHLVELTKAQGQQQMWAHGVTWLALAEISDAVESSADLLDQAAGVLRDLSDQWGLAFALLCRGSITLIKGDPAVAASFHAAALAAAGAIASEQLYVTIVDMLGVDAVAIGDISSARAHFAEAARIHIRILDQQSSSLSLANLAGLAQMQGRPAVAARLIGASDRIRETIGTAILPGMQPLYEILRTSVIGVIGPEAYAQAAAEGARMRIPDAFAYALDATAEEAGHGAARTSPPIPVARWDRPDAAPLMPWWTGAPQAEP